MRDTSETTCAQACVGESVDMTFERGDLVRMRSELGFEMYGIGVVQTVGRNHRGHVFVRAYYTKTGDTNVYEWSKLLIVSKSPFRCET